MDQETDKKVGNLHSPTSVLLLACCLIGHALVSGMTRQWEKIWLFYGNLEAGASTCALWGPGRLLLEKTLNESWRGRKCFPESPGSGRTANGIAPVRLSSVEDCAYFSTLCHHRGRRNPRGLRRKIKHNSPYLLNGCVY